jgi:hypothetical protein
MLLLMCQFCNATSSGVSGDDSGMIVVVMPLLMVVMVVPIL